MSLDTTEIRMTNLFLQLGLDSSENAIATFIANHPLTAQTHIVDANFWNEGQRQMLREMLKANAEWAVLVDQLNEALHH